VIVDSHVHVVADDTVRYPLQPSGVGSSWFRDRPVTSPALAAEMDAQDVERAVLVQAMGAYRFDNSYVLDAAAADRRRFAPVCIVDTTPRAAAEAARELAGLAALRGAQGVRIFAIPDGAWIDDQASDAIWELAASLGWTVAIAMFADELPRLDRMLTRHPDVPVALDHCGFADLSGAAPYAAAAGLFALARHPQLHLKVTSHVLLHAADPAALVTHLATAFGADRLVWGSDFPQTEDASYADLVALGRRSVAGLPEPDQAKVLGRNALRLWPIANP
jgi:predicted TIM-barrel fold metal-dependent hydrolase